MNVIFFIPLLVVVILIYGYRQVIRKRPLGIRGWLISIALILILGLGIPLAYGVWLPDIFGKQHTLCSVSTSTGYQVSIVQYWNHVDFYTTEAQITSPDGITSISLIDGDASKIWSATLKIDPAEKGTTYTLPNGRSGTFTW